MGCEDTSTILLRPFGGLAYPSVDITFTTAKLVDGVLRLKMLYAYLTQVQGKRRGRRCNSSGKTRKRDATQASLRQMRYTRAYKIRKLLSQFGKLVWACFSRRGKILVCL